MKKILFDLFPLILFFAAFKLAGSNPDQAAALATAIGYQADPKQLPILIATAVAIVATFMQISWVWLRHRKVDTMLWVSLVIIGVFGGVNFLEGGWVYGREGDAGIADVAGVGVPVIDPEEDYSYNLNWNAHARGRVGFATGQLLVFAAGGLAVASANTGAAASPPWYAQ